MADKMFPCAGVSRKRGTAVVRFGKDLNRIKIFVKDNHTDITFIQLPEPMTEGAAVAYLKTLPEFDTEAAKEAFANFEGGVRKAGREGGSAPKVKAPKAEKAPKVAKVKVQKAVVGSLTDKPKITGLTVEEIEDIKAKNLALLKKVGKKFQKGQYAEGKEGGFSEAEKAEALNYVQAVTEDLDSFKVPETLTMDEVKSLI